MPQQQQRQQQYTQRSTKRTSVGGGGGGTIARKRTTCAPRADGSRRRSRSGPRANTATTRAPSPQGTNATTTATATTSQLAKRPSDSKPVLLVMDVGTFCDHRLMNTAILKLREQYRLVYLTDKSHKLPEEITRITYTFPTSVLDNAGEMTTAFTSGWYHALMYLMVHPSITRESVVSLVDVSRLLVRTIRVHKPARILAHCGNLQHIVASRCYRTIPTSILYFAPGMLPNTSVPFVFHDALTARDLRVHGGASNSSEAERTGFAYQDQIQNSASLVERTTAKRDHRGARAAARGWAQTARDSYLPTLVTHDTHPVFRCTARSRPAVQHQAATHTDSWSAPCAAVECPHSHGPAAVDSSGQAAPSQSCW
jgi:hypothetical protein